MKQNFFGLIILLILLVSTATVFADEFVMIRKCAVETFKTDYACENGFRFAYWRCSDGREVKNEDTSSCKPTELWKQYAVESCERSCIANTAIPAAATASIEKPQVLPATMVSEQTFAVKPVASTINPATRCEAKKSVSEYGLTMNSPVTLCLRNIINKYLDIELGAKCGSDVFKQMPEFAGCDESYVLPLMFKCVKQAKPEISEEIDSCFALNVPEKAVKDDDDARERFQLCNVQISMALLPAVNNNPDGICMGGELGSLIVPPAFVNPANRPIPNLKPDGYLDSTKQILHCKIPCEVPVKRTCLKDLGITTSGANYDVNPVDRTRCGDVSTLPVPVVGIPSIMPVGVPAVHSVPAQMSCLPRPPCLDAIPRCMVAEPKDGWCPASITPLPTMPPTAMPVPPIALPSVQLPPLPVQTQQCNGCEINNNCLPFGTRIKDVQGSPSFCDIDKTVKAQKSGKDSCDNSYECVGNACGNGICQSSTNNDERIAQLEKELKEQRTMLQKILDFFKGWFS